ncbi:MAG: cyclic peptide export ABC transporter [Xenococcaceae cyanobacterium MO_188.B32]|nr:cyclic peptide export ABC transporter [Xenococcaceae cyanobacterium MO_188.B32]
MKIIRLLCQKSGKLFIIAVIASLFTGASSAGLIALINYILQNIERVLISTVASFVGLCLLLMISSAVSWILLTQLSQDVIYNLRLKLSERILACPLSRLEILGTPKLLAAMTEDVNTIADSSIAVSGMGVNISLVVGCFAYLCWLSFPVFCLFLGVIILGIFSYQYIANRGRAGFKVARAEQDVLFQHFQTVTQGIKELKLHRQRRNEFFCEDLKATAARVRYHWMQGMTSFAIAGGYGLGLFFIPLAILLLVLPRFIFIPQEVLSSYTLTFLYAITPLRSILTTLPLLSQTSVALENIESLGLSLTEQIIEPTFPTGSNFDRDWKSLELVDIHHAYQGEKEEHQFSLDRINLKFKPGEIVFIVGGNGSGKSTLVKLITGLYTPNRGKILFNNISVTDNNREWYRQQFSVIFYDFYLFERLLGIEANQEVEIQNYLKLLEIEHKVTIKDGILSTTNLSQGQRKRLALLTAYLEDRPIYVFDEWASDQDPLFKEVFYKKLLPELKSRGKTVIAVSHDDRYFQDCDRIVKLDYGQVLIS